MVGCIDNWSVKALRRKTTGTGRMRYLRNVPRRFKSNFREGNLILHIVDIHGSTPLFVPDCWMIWLYLLCWVRYWSSSKEEERRCCLIKCRRAMLVCFVLLFLSLQTGNFGYLLNECYLLLSVTSCFKCWRVIHVILINRNYYFYSIPNTYYLYAWLVMSHINSSFMKNTHFLSDLEKTINPIQDFRK